MYAGNMYVNAYHFLNMLQSQWHFPEHNLLFLRHVWALCRLCLGAGQAGACDWSMPARAWATAATAATGSTGSTGSTGAFGGTLRCHRTHRTLLRGDGGIPGVHQGASEARTKGSNWTRWTPKFLGCKEIKKGGRLFQIDASRKGELSFAFCKEVTQSYGRCSCIGWGINVCVLVVCDSHPFL
jgi:hypothetical protein